MVMYCTIVYYITKYIITTNYVLFNIFFSCIDQPDDIQ